ncbi:MAG: DUF2341 domain-containing protein [Fibrobacteres bacterium]|jgi:hypothetical protein|nr:DUF2341 domain-containing protein [Fibrobacterota bacterium]
MRSPRFPARRKALCVGLCVWGLQACSEGRLAGKPVVDETTNGLHARIRLADGSPAASAKVRLTPGWYVVGAVDSANRTFQTNSDGELEIQGLDAGSWWIEATLASGGNRTLLDWNPQLPRPADLVLMPSGRLVGQTFPLATVRLYGSDRSVLTDSQGRYVLDSLPPGPLSLRVDAATSGGDSLIGEATVQILTGETTTAVVREPVSTDRALWKEGRLAVIPADPSNQFDSLANFLVPITLGARDFADGITKPEDLLVTDRQGRALEFHLESWSLPAKKAVLWAKVPRVHPRQGDTLRLLWGKSGFVSRLAYTPTDSTYGIWHLDEADPLTNAHPSGPAIAKDSGTIAATGIVGEGRRFEINHWMRIASPGATSLAGGFTISCWVRLEGRQPNHAKILDLGPSAQPFGTILLDIDTSTGKAGMQISLADSSWQRIETKTPVAGWTHLAATWDGTTREAVFYRDGTEQGRLTTDAPLHDPSGYDLLLGNQSDGLDGIRGVLDEVRWDTSPRSASWIRHLHFTQSAQRIGLSPYSNHLP